MELQASQGVKAIIQKLVESLRNVIDDNLTGVYLHGSLAMGNFNPVSSDIDILVVVKESLSLETKNVLWTHLQLLSQDAPAKGFELSVVTLNALKNFKYPTPYEFHYSPGMSSSQIEDSGEHDPDLAAHFVITKARGICLYGEPIEDNFPEVSRTYYLKSIANDAKWSYNNIQKGPKDGICTVPVYAVLNFCRISAFIQSDLITSKKEAGEWGLENLPRKYKSIIQEALREYSQSGAGAKINAALLKHFADYSWSIIRKASRSRTE